MKKEKKLVKTSQSIQLFRSDENDCGEDREWTRLWRERME